MPELWMDAHVHAGDSAHFPELRQLRQLRRLQRRRRREQLRWRLGRRWWGGWSILSVAVHR